MGMAGRRWALGILHHHMHVVDIIISYRQNRWEGAFYTMWGFCHNHKGVRTLMAGSASREFLAKTKGEEGGLGTSTAPHWPDPNQGPQMKVQTGPELLRRNTD